MLIFAVTACQTTSDNSSTSNTTTNNTPANTSTSPAAADPTDATSSNSESDTQPSDTDPASASQSSSQSSPQGAPDTDSGAESADEPQAPDGSHDTTVQSGVPAPAGATTEETIDGLDAQLDDSMAVFDGMILEEQAKAEASTASAYGNNETGEADTGESLFEEGDLNEGLPGYGEFPESQDADDNEVADSNGEGGDTDSQGEPSGTEDSGEYADASDAQTGPSGSSSSTTRGIPVDIGSGQDDDIVARQIREAAQKEKDPVLQEKLWEEYRKYKNQQRAN